MLSVTSGKAYAECTRSALADHGVDGGNDIIVGKSGIPGHRLVASRSFRAPRGHRKRDVVHHNIIGDA